MVVSVHSAQPAASVISITQLVEVVTANPYDHASRGMLADTVFYREAEYHPVGSPARSKFLLHWLTHGFPTPTLRAAYMQHLRALLHRRPRQARPGHVVLGLGTGRSGSTSLSHIMAGIPDSCATHENPPMIYWRPDPEQVAFHLERLALLRTHYAVVFDAAHWWLHAVDAVRARFPDARFIGLRRKLMSCVNSFVQIKGIGPGTCNHWLPPDSPLTAQTSWDPTYPSYNFLSPTEGQTEAGKRRLIETYLRDYNAQMQTLAAECPPGWLLLSTETLHHRGTQQRIFDHVGVSGEFTAARLNVGTVDDGDIGYKF